MLIGVGAFYNVSSAGAPLSSADTALKQPIEFVALSEPVITTTDLANAASIEDREELQELASVQQEEQEEQEIQLKEPQQRESEVSEVKEGSATVSVPFYSQFDDISAVEWRKIGCGIASLAMIIDFYEPAVSVDILLTQGIAAGAYLRDAGWTYKGLIGVGQKYGLGGSSHDLAPLSSKAAFEEFKEYVKDGPVIASVHYEFDPASTIPHLVVINEIAGDVVYYNDPAAKTGQKQISTADFLSAWKKRFIVIRPVKTALPSSPASSSLALSL